MTVKGLSEREFDASIIIWPLQFTEAGNDLEALYTTLETGSALIRNYLQEAGVATDAITLAPPAIVDRYAQQYGDGSRAEFRYAATQTVTVYSEDIPIVQAAMRSLSELGKQGLVFTGADYQAQPEYLFTRLNEVKPGMIEEATRNARQVAEKFAEDSQSTLGGIRTASQGQFVISDRDRNNPHIKNVRVVVTIDYYLSD